MKFKMPIGDFLHTAWTPSVSIGVLAGIFGGAYYIFVKGYKWFGQRTTDATHCYICSQPFPSNLPSQGVICTECGRKVCRPAELETVLSEESTAIRTSTKCSIWDENEGKWICFICLPNNGAYKKGVDEISIDPKCVHLTSTTNGSIHLGRMSDESDEREIAAAAQWERERHRIREILERCAGHMVGGDLDNVSVGRLYSHSEYERMFSNYHSILSTSLANLATYLQTSNKNLPPVSKINISDDYDNISIAELGLRDVIRRVAREASRLPWLGNGDLHQRSINSGGNVRQPPDSTYEDLLATAILNKVIESYQKKAPQNLSELGSFSSHRTSRSNSIRTNPLDDLPLDSFTREKNEKYLQQRDIFNRPIHVNPLLDDERFSEQSEHHSIDEGYAGQSGSSRNKYSNKQIDEDGASLSSLEDYSGESCSSKPRNGISLTIKQSIEEMTSSDLDSYDPQLESSDYSEKNATLKRKNICDRCSLVTDDDIDLKQPELWEENWLFQKKKTKSNIISTPVAMLVPKSSTDYRALIGDRDAEDTTDLSDVGSDYEDNDEASSKSGDFKSILVTSKTLIGGKNDFGFIEEVIDDDTVNLSIELTTKLPDSTDENVDDMVEKVESKQDVIPKQPEVEECAIAAPEYDIKMESIPELITTNKSELKNLNVKIEHKNKEETLLSMSDKKVPENPTEFKFNENVDLSTDSVKECNIKKHSKLEIVSKTPEETEDKTTINTFDKIENKLDDSQNAQYFVPKTSFEEIYQEIVNENESNFLEGQEKNGITSEDVENYEAFTVDTTLKGVKMRVQKWDNFIEKKTDEIQSSPVHVNKILKKDVLDKYFKMDNDIEREKKVLNEAKNSTLLNDHNSENNSVETNVQKDNEYTEQYNTIGKKEIECPTAAPRSYVNTNKDEIDINDTPPQKGTIAEREHLKWQNAVPMPNNPYTAENIEKRLSQRSISSSLLPNITTLERRNSYKRDIDLSENNNCDDNDIEVSFKIISVEELSNTGTNHSSEFSNSSIGCDKECFDTKEDKIDSREIINLSDDNSDKHENMANVISTPEKSVEDNSIYKTDMCLNNNKNKNNNVFEKCAASNENFELNNTPIRIINMDNDDQSTNVNKVEYYRSNSKSSRPNSALSGCTTPGGSSLQEIFGNDNTDSNKRFGRDFYVREAKQASGARKRFSELNQELCNNYQSDGEENLEIETEGRIINSNDDLIYKATPVEVIDDSINAPHVTNFKLNADPEMVEQLSMISSSDSYDTSNSLDVQRVYNLDSGEIVYRATNSQYDKSTTEKPHSLENSINSTNRLDRVNYFKSPNKTIESYELLKSVQEIKTPFKNEADEISSNNYSNEIDLISFNSIPDNEITIIEKGSTDLLSNSCNSLNNTDKERNFENTNQNEVELTVEQRKQKILNLLKINKEQLDLNENKMKPVHSLTARSLSKQFRLPNSQSSPQLNQCPIERHRLATYTPDLKDSPKLTLKEKREFFENLNRK